MDNFLIIDVLLWIIVSALGFAALCGISVLAVFVIKVIKDMIKNF